MTPRRRGNLYERRVFPWLNDRLTAAPEIRRIRVDALQDARGLTVEIGFGSGASLAFYPPAVRLVIGVEPNEGMLDRAIPRIASSSIPVRIVIGEAERLPIADRSADTAVTMLTLCSVESPAAAVQELRRVLRDEGRLIVLEHGLSPEPGIARWQHRLNGLEKVIACGCNLNRPVVSLLEANGFRFDTLRQFSMPGAPRTHGWMTVGAAVKGR